MDFSETYASVGMLTTFEYLISLIVRDGRNIDQLDVVTAFRDTDIEDDNIYVTLLAGCPEGFITPKIIVRLRKALYGLELAPRLWHNQISPFLLPFGFTQSSADSNLYLCSESILMLLYINDISILYPKATAKAAIEDKPKSWEKYKITNLVLACHFMGIKIYPNALSTGISLGQKAHITTVFSRFGMEHTHGVPTPMDPNVKFDLAKHWGEKELKDTTDYQAVVGSLIYTALATWADNSYVVASLSHYILLPFISPMTTAKRVLQYLESTADCRLRFTCNTNGIGIGIGININNSFIGYLDFVWANECADRKSQGGYVFLASNWAVSWQSRKEGLIAMGTLEAKSIACSEASSEGTWLLQLEKDIDGSQSDSPPPPINCDNQGALTPRTTGIIKARTKDIDVLDRNSQDLHKCRIVNYSHVCTNENVADILIKAVRNVKHTKFTKGKGLW